MCGNWFTSGPDSVTRTSRGAGSRPGTSVRSIPPGTTRGSSGAGKPVSTCVSSPGHQSSDTGWWRAGHPWMTPTSPPTGPEGVAGTVHHGGVTGLLLRAQHGRCPIYRGLLLDSDHEPQSPQEWEQWLKATRLATRKRAPVAWGAGTPDERATTRLIHTQCHRRTLDGGAGTSLQPTRTPTGLA